MTTIESARASGAEPPQDRCRTEDLCPAGFDSSLAGQRRLLGANAVSARLKGGLGAAAESPSCLSEVSCWRVWARHAERCSPHLLCEPRPGRCFSLCWRAVVSFLRASRFSLLIQSRLHTRT